jgi:hypothetical protein
VKKLKIFRIEMKWSEMIDSILNLKDINDFQCCVNLLKQEYHPFPRNVIEIDRTQELFESNPFISSE